MSRGNNEILRLLKKWGKVIIFRMWKLIGRIWKFGELSAEYKKISNILRDCNNYQGIKALMNVAYKVLPYQLGGLDVWRDGDNF